MYNEIDATGGILNTHNRPDQFSAHQIRKEIYEALNLNDYTFEWTQKRSQPYSGKLYDGLDIIDVFIYSWNITAAYRNNPSEKRVQIPAKVNNVGMNRPFSKNEKTIILGLYNSPTGDTLYAAWDVATNRNHAQKSCYVQIEDLAAAISEGIHQTSDKNGAPIYTMTGDSLADYVSNLEDKNVINTTASTISSSSPLKKRMDSAGKKKRKARNIKKIESIRNKIDALSETEKEAVQKIRVGQGYFRDLLIDKHSCKCVLCNITTKSMLIASHIKPWAVCNNDEKLDEYNGLLLCEHHDALFDKKLISFDDSGNLLVSPTLSSTEQTVLGIPSIPKITVPNEMKPYLAYHRSKLKK